MTIEELLAQASVDQSNPRWRLSVPAPEVATFEADKQYRITMETSEGAVVIRMMPEVAPMHVTSFLYLAKLGYFDGLAFHRVIPGFMAQGGCPLGSGTGGPGYQFGGEFDPSVRHDRPGLLSMANAGPGTDGSQFFLTFVATPWLDGKHTIFGEVIDGHETLGRLESLGTDSGRPTQDVKINRVVL